MLITYPQLSLENPEDSKNQYLSNKTEGSNKNDEEYVDYDNTDSDEETDANFKCQQCKFSSNTRINLTKHIKSEHINTCDKCNI